MSSAVVFGEILWDIFGEKKEIGGAAFNFAAHMVSLGDEVQFASAVGDDELGHAALREIESRGVKSDLMTVSDKRTGACYVTLNADGKPSYDLLDDIAYDYITASTDKRYDMLYLGTLARRRSVSRNTCLDLMTSGLFSEVFCDINVRKPFISPEVTIEALKHATIVKLSREEYQLIEDYGIAKVRGGDYNESLCMALSNAFPNLHTVIVTLDKDGAMLYSAMNECFLYSEKPTSKLVSAVGAGDSFSACFMHNYLQNHSLTECLNRGVALSDYVVTQLGAIPPLPESLKERII